MQTRKLATGLILTAGLLLVCSTAAGADNVALTTLNTIDARGVQSVRLGKFEKFCGYWQDKAAQYPKSWKTVKFGGKVFLWGLQVASSAKILI